MGNQKRRYGKENQEKFTQNLFCVFHIFKQEGKPKKKSLENENQTWKYGKWNLHETINPNVSTFFYVLHSMWKIQHCSVGDCFSSFSCLLFHAIVCVLWEKYEIDGSSAQNLVLTKIDMKGASAVWRERRDGLLEGKIPRWVLLEKAPTLSLHFETVKSQTFFEFLFSFGILWQTQEVRIFI